jgi:hypothetical protein
LCVDLIYVSAEDKPRGLRVARTFVGLWKKGGNAEEDGNCCLLMLSCAMKNSIKIV